MKIKKAMKKDLKEIGKLMLSEFSKPPYNEKAKINDVLKSLEFYFKNAKIYIAIDKEIQGVLVFQIEQWWEGKVIIVQDLAIKEKFQNKKIGYKLMNFLEDYSKKNKIKKIHFETNKKTSALNFYKKLNYKIKTDRIIMEKEIK